MNINRRFKFNTKGIHLELHQIRSKSFKAACLTFKIEKIIKTLKNIIYLKVAWWICFKDGFQSKEHLDVLSFVTA